MSAQTLRPLERPWQGLDPALADLLEPGLAQTADEIIAAIGAQVPQYSQPMQGAFGRGLRTAIDEALRQFLDQLGRPAPAERPGREVYVGLGRGEFRAGRGLDALQAAYRIGARIAWRRISATAQEAGIDAPTLSQLAEAIFAYIDELSAESVEGFAREQAASAGERQRRHGALVRQLVDRELDAAEAEREAQATGWQLPRTLAALVADHADPERLAARVGEGSIGGRVGELVCVLVPDPQAPGRGERIARALGKRTSTLGPAVPWQQARDSHARAQRCVELQLAGVLPGERMLVAEEQLGALALFSEPKLLEELAQRRLGALAELTPVQRARLETTLLEWLRHQGNVSEVADALYVHPQTVRYRLARLRELMGEQLDDPDARFELELALRARAGVVTH